MKKAYVTLAALLKLKAEDVEAAFNDTDESKAESMIAEINKDKTVYSKEELAAYETNLTNKVKAEHLEELITAAKEGKLPKELHSPIKGAVLEQKTKELAPKYGLDATATIDELFEKAVKTSPDVEKERAKNAELLASHQKYVAETDEKLKNKESEVNNRLSTLELDSIYSGIKFKSPVEKQANQRELLKSHVARTFTTQWDEKLQRVVFLKNGEILKDPKTFDPLQSKDVISGLAAENFDLETEDTGGRGDAGSGHKPSAGNTADEWIAAKKAEGQDPFSTENLKEFAEKFPDL